MKVKREKLKTYHLRITSQILFFIVAILGVFGVGMTGVIYPFFFCPASPGACGGCPIWVLEHGTLLALGGSLSGAMMMLYLLGLFLVIGVLVGRSFCGWACPMGSLQDLFSFFRRKGTERASLILGGVSLSMLLIGILLPYVFSKLEVDQQYYMWSGYVGALGIFGSALSGYLLSKGIRGLLYSSVSVVMGGALWITALIAEDIHLGDSPLGSIELMGLLGLIYFTMGLLGVASRAMDLHRLKPRLSVKADQRLRLVKVGLLLGIPLSTWYFDTLAFTDLDPVGAITATIPELLLNPTEWSGNEFFWYKIAFTVIVLVLMAATSRAWCRYLCPIGAMYGPTNKISLIDISYTREDCIHCQKCIRVCPMAINPKEDKRDMECIRCGRCVDACPASAQRFVILKRPLKEVFGR